MKAGSVQIIVLLIALSLAATAQAQGIEPRESPPQTAVRAARLIDVRTGKVIDDAVVLIEGDRIKSVGTNLAVPSNARTIDLGNATLLPGLIDAHAHLLHQTDGDAAALIAAEAGVDSIEHAYTISEKV